MSQDRDGVAATEAEIQRHAPFAVREVRDEPRRGDHRPVAGEVGARGRGRAELLAGGQAEALAPGVEQRSAERHAQIAEGGPLHPGEVKLIGGASPRLSSRIGRSAPSDSTPAIPTEP